MSEETPAKRAKLDQDTEVGVGEVEELAGRDEGEQAASPEADAILEQELRSAQADLDKETEEMLEKMRQLEHEYNLRKQPLYHKRSDVIQRIPGFWLHCFMQHEEIRLVLGAVDQSILSSLTGLEVLPFEDVKAGYKLVMHFGENKFFEDKQLEKEVRFHQEGDQHILCTVSGCQPKWRGEDPTNPDAIKTGRKRGRDSIAFFRWFTEPNEFEPGLIDNLADIIKEQLWVNPLEFMDGDEEPDEEGGEVIDLEDDSEVLEGEEGIDEPLLEEWESTGEGKEEDPAQQPGYQEGDGLFQQEEVEEPAEGFKEEEEPDLEEYEEFEEEEADLEETAQEGTEGGEEEILPISGQDK